jgi:hypothetical protein
MALGLSLVLLSGCDGKESREASETDGDHEEASAAARHERRPFVIREAGMRFDPPATWDLARIDMETRAGDDAAERQAGAAHWVAFDYKAEQPAHLNHPLLLLMAFPKATWVAIAAEPGPPVGAPIDSVDAWVIVASLAQANPYREGSLDADQFGAMMLTLADVREAFSIEGDGPTDIALRSVDAKGR